VVRLQFALVGGDARAAWLARILAGEGQRVRCFALEKAGLPPKFCAGSLEGCVYGADWVVLGVPAEKQGRLLTPLSVQELETAELLAALWPGQVLCGGMLAQGTALAAVRAHLSVCDLMARRDFTVGNAALTAEGAIGLLLRESEQSLWKSRALITGWGRIASLLAPRLSALGCQVTVAARKAGDRAMAEALGLAACRFGELEEIAGEQDYIINTVPAEVLGRAVLERVRPDAVLLELASAPGFDRENAEALGLHAVYAPGLPGKTAPHAAARLMRDVIAAAIREREENDGS